MKKPYLFILLLFVLSCKDYSEINLSANADSNIKLKIDNRSKSMSDAEIINDFDDAITDATTSDFNNLMSNTYQSSSEYVALSNASIQLLQEAEILDSVKYYLNIYSNSDPRLVIAAKLVNDIVTHPIPPDTTVAAMPGWVNCLVQAGIGVSAQTLSQIVAGGSIKLVGEAIKHMGVKWFALTVGKTLGKVVSGVGGVIMIAEFSWCMATEYGSEDIIDEYGFVAVDLVNSNLPIQSSPTVIMYWSNMEQLLDPEIDYSTDIPVFFNSLDNKYYSNSSYSTYTPNGYYWLNSTKLYYYIHNGEVNSVLMRTRI